MIFNVSEVIAINFLDVLETSIETLRKSLDGVKTFVKWEGVIPDCVYTLTTKEGPYSHAEILAILSEEAWTNPLQFPK